VHALIYLRQWIEHTRLVHRSLSLAALFPSYALHHCLLLVKATLANVVTMVVWRFASIAPKKRRGLFLVK
jgi:hypothetical protein